MRVKVKQKYEIVTGEEVIECDSFEEMVKKLKSLRSSELDCYPVKKEYKGDKLIGEWLIGE